MDSVTNTRATPPDADLMRLVQAGQTEAFEPLHQRHRSWVCAFLRRSGLGEADAADVAQEAFVRAYRGATRFDPHRGTFASWLAAITRNCLARHFGRREDGRSVDLHLLAEIMPGREGPPGLELESSERAAAVEDCVSRLPVELRRIVELRYVGERTTRDIAAAAGISEASVRNRLSEARDALAQCLGRKGVL